MILASGLALLMTLAQEKAKPQEEETLEVRKGNLTPTLEVEAFFEALRTADVRLRPEAYQGELVIQKVAGHGEPVLKGDVLLALDSRHVERQLASAENDLRAAEAAFRKVQAEEPLAEAGETLAREQSERALKNAETALKVFDEIIGRQMLTRMELNVKAHEDYVSDQTEELEQIERMYKTEELANATAEIVVRRARRSLERLKIFLVMARDTARVFQDVDFPEQRKNHVHAVDAARQSLEQLKVQQAHARALRQAERFRARESVEKQEEQMAKLKRDLEAFTVRSPFDGRVFYGPFQMGQWAMAQQFLQQVQVGERAQTHQILMTACAPGVRAVADVPEANYFDVHPQQPAKVKPVPLPDVEIQGRVRSKGVTSVPKGTEASFEARIELAEQHPDLLPGMKAKVTLVGKELLDVTLVPSKAVQSSGQKRTATVLKDGKKESREITVGLSDGKMTHVKRGLEAGEKVLLPR